METNHHQVGGSLASDGTTSDGRHQSIQLSTSPGVQQQPFDNYSLPHQHFQTPQTQHPQQFQAQHDLALSAVYGGFGSGGTSSRTPDASSWQHAQNGHPNQDSGHTAYRQPSGPSFPSQDFQDSQSSQFRIEFNADESFPPTAPPAFNRSLYEQTLIPTQNTPNARDSSQVNAKHASNSNVQLHNVDDFLAQSQYPAQAQPRVQQHSPHSHSESPVPVQEQQQHQYGAQIHQDSFHGSPASVQAQLLQQQQKHQQQYEASHQFHQASPNQQKASYGQMVPPQQGGQFMGQLPVQQTSNAQQVRLVQQHGLPQQVQPASSYHQAEFNSPQHHQQMMASMTQTYSLDQSGHPPGQQQRIDQMALQRQQQERERLLLQRQEQLRQQQQQHQQHQHQQQQQQQHRTAASAYQSLPAGQSQGNSSVQPVIVRRSFIGADGPTAVPGQPPFSVQYHGQSSAQTMPQGGMTVLGHRSIEGQPQISSSAVLQSKRPRDNYVEEQRDQKRTRGDSPSSDWSLNAATLDAEKLRTENPVRFMDLQVRTMFDLFKNVEYLTQRFQRFVMDIPKERWLTQEPDEFETAFSAAAERASPEFWQGFQSQRLVLAARTRNWLVACVKAKKLSSCAGVLRGLIKLPLSKSEIQETKLDGVLNLIIKRAADDIARLAREVLSSATATSPDSGHKDTEAKARPTQPPAQSKPMQRSAAGASQSLQTRSGIIPAPQKPSVSGSTTATAKKLEALSKVTAPKVAKTPSTQPNTSQAPRSSHAATRSAGATAAIPTAKPAASAAAKPTSLAAMAKAAAKPVAKPAAPSQSSFFKILEAAKKPGAEPKAPAPAPPKLFSGDQALKKQMTTGKAPGATKNTDDNAVKKKKKAVRWRDENLVETRFFEIDDQEHAYRSATDAKRMDVNEARAALRQSDIDEIVEWYEPELIDVDVTIFPKGVFAATSTRRGGKREPDSKDAEEQRSREAHALVAVYYNEQEIPPSPGEPPIDRSSMKTQTTPPKEIPLPALIENHSLVLRLFPPPPLPTPAEPVATSSGHFSGHSDSGASSAQGTPEISPPPPSQATQVNPQLSTALAALSNLTSNPQAQATYTPEMLQNIMASLQSLVAGAQNQGQMAPSASGMLMPSNQAQPAIHGSFSMSDQSQGNWQHDQRDGNGSDSEHHRNNGDGERRAHHGDPSKRQFDVRPFVRRETGKLDRWTIPCHFFRGSRKGGCKREENCRFLHIEP